MTRLAPTLLLTALLSCGTATLAQAQSALTTQIESGRSVREGAEGEAVRELQQSLNRLGYSVTVDGDFGPRTKAAVEAFQRSKQLTPDGIVGRRTLAALDQALGAAGASGILLGDRNGRRPTDGGSTSSAPTTRFERPHPRTAENQVRAQALAWARAARARGSRTLVVAYEGLWSHSQRYTNKIYAYQDALIAGRQAERPGGVSMNFVSKHLLVPNMARNYRQVDYLILPETSEKRSNTSVAERTILAWREVHGANLRLVLVGHSFGSTSALRLCKKLERRGVPVQGFVAIDSRSRPGGYSEFVRSSNVRGLWNYFQKGFMPGYEIQGADLNQRIRGVGHGNMPGISPVQERFRALIR